MRRSFNEARPRRKHTPGPPTSIPLLVRVHLFSGHESRGTTHDLEPPGMESEALVLGCT